MQTKAKSNSVITHEVNGRIIAFHVKDAGTVTVNLDLLHPAIIERAAIHGMIQRISDAAAISRDEETGLPALPSDKQAAMQALADHYMTGTEEWKRTGTGTGGAKSITIEAIARVKGWDYDRAKEMVEAYAQKRFEGDTKKTLAELRKAKDVSEAILAIRAERLPKAKADADALLAEMG